MSTRQHGMRLDPQVRALRERLIANPAAPLYARSVAEARGADLAAIRAASQAPEPIHHVSDAVIPGPAGPLPIRVYRPEPAGQQAVPVVVYFFGGGWTLGSLNTSDGVCRTLTNATGCVTVAVQYRLAPEHKFPAAVHDCVAGVRWVAENAASLGVDPARLAVAGDSAGGNLAAAVCLHARAAGGPPIAAQVLVYPNTCYGSDSASMRDNDDPVFFNHRSVAWYWGHYLADPAAGRDPLASPLLAADHHGLPRALVITAEHDPLRDEGEAYADTLAAAGVPVVRQRYLGMMHGFFTMTGELDAAVTCAGQVADYLRDVFAGERR